MSAILPPADRNRIAHPQHPPDCTAQWPAGPHREHPHVRSVSMGVWIASGSRDEPLELNGISHFVEHMVFKGTTTRNAQQFAREVDSIGGNLDAFTGKENICFNIKVLDENIAPALELLSDLVLHPTFTPEDIASRAGRDSGGDQDGRGQPRLPRPRDLHAELLEGQRPRPPYPGHSQERLQLHPAGGLRLLRRPVHPAQHGLLRRREPGSRPLCGAGRRAIQRPRRQQWNCHSPSSPRPPPSPTSR